MMTIRLHGGVSIEFGNNPRMLELWLQKLRNRTLSLGVGGSGYFPPSSLPVRSLPI